MHFACLCAESNVARKRINCTILLLWQMAIATLCACCHSCMAMAHKHLQTLVRLHVQVTYRTWTETEEKPTLFGIWQRVVACSVRKLIGECRLGSWSLGPLCGCAHTCLTAGGQSLPSRQMHLQGRQPQAWMDEIRTASFNPFPNQPSH
jgi:hypothetical protein